MLTPRSIFPVAIGLALGAIVDVAAPPPGAPAAERGPLACASPDSAAGQARVPAPPAPERERWGAFEATAAHGRRAADAPCDGRRGALPRP